MNVPPGTWTAETRPENAKSRPAYPKNGPNHTDLRRDQAPITIGTRSNPAQASVVKIPTAATRPPIRLSRNGPMPWPRSQSSVAGVVIEFHSSIERMNRTLPDVEDGEIEPKTASCRMIQGAITMANKAAQANADQTGIAGRREPPERQARQRSHRKARPSVAPTSTPSLRANVANPTSSPARANARASPRRPRAPSQRAPATSGWKSEKLSGWTMKTRSSNGRATITPAPTATSRLVPASRAIAQVSGAAIAPISANGRA